MWRFRITARECRRNDLPRFSPKGQASESEECASAYGRSHGEMTIESNALGTRIFATFPAELSMDETSPVQSQHR